MWNTKFRGDSLFCFVTRKRVERLVLLTLTKIEPNLPESETMTHVSALQITAIVHATIVFAVPLVFNIIFVILIIVELNKKVTFPTVAGNIFF